MVNKVYDLSIARFGNLRAGSVANPLPVSEPRFSSYLRVLFAPLRLFFLPPLFTLCTLYARVQAEITSKPLPSFWGPRLYLTRRWMSLKITATISISSRNIPTC